MWRFRRTLFAAIGSLTLTLVISLVVQSFLFNHLQSTSDQRVNIQQDTDGILQAMLDQETGIRGYLSTNGDKTFLDPFTTGRASYLNQVQQLRDEISSSNSFKSTEQALTEVEVQADNWYTNFAEVVLNLTNSGNIDGAKNLAIQGKNLFDSFRTAVSNLKTAAQKDSAALQDQTNLINLIIFVTIAFISVTAIIGTGIFSNRFANYLGNQLGRLTSATLRLQEGDLTTRVDDLPDDEIGLLGQNFNSMAEALQQQQDFLKERDVLENVTQLTNTIITSIELNALTSKFLTELIHLLGLQLGAIYLYDNSNRTLTLANAQGLNMERFQQQFSLGEGTLGQAALNRRPYYVSQPDATEVAGTESLRKFEIKTFLGNVMPAAIYDVPLLRGEALVGVLVVASIYPISEKVRNVLNVVAVSLSTAISNAQAYTHIQEQSFELEHRRQSLEGANIELGRQRDELAIVNSALEEASRTRNQFFSTMSHELRTPLTSIIGFTQILLRPSATTNLNNRQKDNLERILKNSQHLLTLINSVLDLAKIDAGRMEVSYKEISLEAFLGSIVDQTGSLALQKNLKLQLEVDKGTSQIKTDPDKLRQIIFNLVSNALKFTETGGVTITVAPLPFSSDKFGHTNLQHVSIAVKDTGIGIEPKVLPHIFDEFYQADNTDTRKYGGTGLGLSIARKLTELLNGKLEVQSELGKGTTFTLILPTQPPRLQEQSAYPLLAQSPNSTLPAAVTSALVGAGLAEPAPTNFIDTANSTSNEVNLPLKEGELLVVAVDDEPDVIHLIKEALEDSVYRVIGVGQSVKALETIRRLQPYSVILDVMMPEANGWQILQQLKSDEATASIPVVMLSVIAERSVGYFLGATDYLLKPVDPWVLLNTLSRLHNPNSVATVAEQASDAAKDLQGNETNYLLVVDDEPDIRAMLEQVLGDAGYQVKTVASGLEALNMVATSLPSAILLDLMMPGLDGFTVLSQLRSEERTANIPVIILTAKTLTADDLMALKCGTDLIFQKGGLDVQELTIKLKHILNEYHRT